MNLMGKITSSIVIFHSYVTNYQRALHPKAGVLRRGTVARRRPAEIPEISCLQVPSGLDMDCNPFDPNISIA